MKISIKLKHTQLSSLVALLEDIIKTEESTTRAEAIIITLMVKFYMKLKKQAIVLEPRIYRFGIEPETAMAFVEFFNGIPFDQSTHAGNITQNLIGELDKQTAKFY